MRFFNRVAAAATGFCVLFSTAAFADVVTLKDVTGRDVDTRRIGQVFGMPNVNEPERRMLDFHHWLMQHTKRLHRASRIP
ncbi:hypothetical protein D9M72_566910 [compost metagenome]